VSNTIEYSKSSLIRINWGWSSGLINQKIALKDKKLIKQINGKFNNISGAD
jgi:hypothetical protein